MNRIDIDEIREKLCEYFPGWSGWISRLEIEDGMGVQPVDNDGRSIWYNSRILRYDTVDVQCFYIAQQLLHLRLNHFSRGRDKDRRVWKLASDTVVNEMLRQEGFQLPVILPPVPDAQDISAEDYYAILIQDPKLREKEPEDQEIPKTEPIPVRKNRQAGKTSQGSRREIDEPGLASAVRGLADLLEPCMQLDFDWFPGDRIRDGMLRYNLKAYPVAHTEILLDTSASVDPDLLREDAVIRVGCFDTQFYGFRDILCDEDIDRLELRGAGGTDFTIAVNAFTGDAENRIIFTDGYAEMPQTRCDAVWVVYGSNPIHPLGGRVLYAKPPQEKEKHEIDFLIT